MTRNHVSQHASLPVRSRGSGTETAEHGAHGVNGNDHYRVENTFIYPSQRSDGVPPYPMYSFGCESGEQASHEFPPPLSPEMHFPASDRSYHEEPNPDDLLAVWMTGEIADSQDLFSDYPSAIEEDFAANTNSWPQMHSYQSGAGTTSYWPQQSHSYVQHSPPVFSAPYSSFTPSGNPSVIPIASSAIYPLPSQASPINTKAHRHIRPKVEGQRRAAPPDASDGDENSNLRGRKRALSVEGRSSARRVRIIGACARCHVLKGRCDTNRPCKPCLSKNKRAYDFPCMPELPEERWIHLFTDGMYGHLDLRGGEVHRRMPPPSQDPSNKPFILRLHQYFDDPELKLPVVKFVPQAEKDITKSTFPIAFKGSKLEVEPTEILSPPLVPFIHDANFAAFTERFRWTIRRWLDCAELHQDLEWHSTFFREEYGKAWPRAVFADTCSFYHKVEHGKCRALKSSLQSTVFAYMLGHSFYVPHEDIQEVVDKTGLSHCYNGDFRFVSPVHVDRFVKAMLYPFFRVCVGKALRGLQDLCGSSKQSVYSRDRILATSIVLLIVAASQQSKAVEKALAMERRGQGVDISAVNDQIAEIEEWIINLVLQIWDYKFNGNVRWGDDEPSDRSPAFRARIFGLYEKFRGSFHPHRADLGDLSTELPKRVDERTFGATNIDRVLKKFYDCVFVMQQGTPKSRSEASTQDWYSFWPSEPRPVQMARREPEPRAFTHQTK